MLLYILKSSAILLVLLLFYKLFLEKENMHVFKRFYLVASLLAAFGIPFITFTSYVFVAPMEEFLQVTTSEPFTGILQEEAKTDYLATVLWTVYGLGVLLFGLKFIKNIIQLLVKIKRNDTIKDKLITKVLLIDLVIPHTFFKYIFLNKADFNNQKIPQEVLLHEETHALQKHSLDVLFIELLQVVFWFNPLIYLMKHAIKLNHEFLADQAVLNHGINTSNYQKTLLHFSANTHQPQLANAINYSFIKKRFTIMKTHTSKKAVWLRSLVLLPLLAVLIYGFSEKVTVEKLTPQIEEQKQDEIYKDIKVTLEDINNFIINYTFKDIEININKNKEILINGENLVTLENLAEEVNKIVSNYSTEQLKNVTAWIQADGILKMAFIIDVKQELKKTGISHYKQSQIFQDRATSEKELSRINQLKINYIDTIPKDTYYKNATFVYRDSEKNIISTKYYNELTYKEKSRLVPPPKVPQKKHPSKNQLNDWKDAKKYGVWIDGARVNNNTLNTISATTIHLFYVSKLAKNAKNYGKHYYQVDIYSKQKYDELYGKGIRPLGKNAKIVFTVHDDVLLLKNSQDKATAEEVIEYNKLAKHYNSQSDEHIVIKVKDFNRIKLIYSKMTKAQKKAAQPFPPPPPPPPLPKGTTKSQKKI